MLSWDQANDDDTAVAALLLLKPPPHQKYRWPLNRLRLLSRTGARSSEACTESRGTGRQSTSPVNRYCA